jgi:1-deoxy-D-xylulose-5-phosphate synthase
LSAKQLPQLADELRAFLLESVARTGGHLSSNLGTVELTVALHHVFDTPHDRLVWDVGHQTYPHKVLTGRRSGMGKLRMRGGVSGFPKRSESSYDTFGVGHSSTSISAALGMALAAKIKGETRKVVAIIGDGAMSAGQAFEALNNAGVADADMLVVLNDNDMSISPAVGALNRYLARLFSGSSFNAARKAGEKILDFSPSLREFAKRAEEHVKGMLTPGTLFEEMGFNYIGPIDGHDLESLVPTLQNLKNLKGPQFLHVITKKGQGYKLAEVDPILYHGVSKFQAGCRHRRTGRAAPNPAIPRFSATGYATWRRPTRNWSVSPRRCVKALACCASANASRNAITTSVSPSSTLSPSPPDSPAKVCARSWRSTRPSCNAATINWCMMWLCRICR